MQSGVDCKQSSITWTPKTHSYHFDLSKKWKERS